MSDEKLPYEEAITEGAKAASNALDLVREGGRAIGPAIGNIYGVLIGDRVAAARERRLDMLEAAQGESRVGWLTTDAVADNSTGRTIGNASFSN